MIQAVLHGLPPEHRGCIDSWSDLIKTLDAIEGSGHPVVVRVETERRDTSGPLQDHGPIAGVQSVGILRRAPAENVDPERRLLIEVRPSVSLMPPYDEGRAFSSWLDLRRDAFSEAHLHTFDGDCYFDLTMRVGDWIVWICDTNRNI
jgi:hypothetical protein